METTSRRLASTSSCFAACVWALAVRMRSVVRTSADADSPTAASRARDSRRAARASPSIARMRSRPRPRPWPGAAGGDPLSETRETRRAARQGGLAQPARRLARELLALGAQPADACEMRQDARALLGGVLAGVARVLS